MDSVPLIKALLIHAAATNAAAVCDETAGGGVPIDPLIQDTQLQGKGVMVYEEAKIQYAALLRAFEDKTGIWPDPKVPDAGSAAAPAAVLPQLLGLLSKVPAATAVPGTVGGVLDLVGKLAAPAAAKQPGQELAK